ncbi:hypothetical protein CEXT_362881 [Caerostris extrusa]|uniref:Uncharacterized protein n=1 Tax=Caerostris extrusa TaxID=172846 RepID=A0AAV4R1J8_CAEEX|nr:hypothetical protein CEXT_362881 [Caerostris extrusa]
MRRRKFTLLLLHCRFASGARGTDQLSLIILLFELCLFNYLLFLMPSFSGFLLGDHSFLSSCSWQIRSGSLVMPDLLCASGGGLLFAVVAVGSHRAIDRLNS